MHAQNSILKLARLQFNVKLRTKEGGKIVFLQQFFPLKSSKACKDQHLCSSDIFVVHVSDM